nr:nucleotide-binding alpha-beta plait domain-containing protein [Tanacetum cinerariifolium]
MGACMSSAGDSIHKSTNYVFVVSTKGELRQFPTPIFVSEVLQYEKPSFFVCNSDNLYQDQDIPSLDSEDELDAGQIYFILPKSMLARRLSASDKASLAVKASLALDSSSNSNSHVKKKKNNNARISPMVLMETSQINVVVEEEENKQNYYKNGGLRVSKSRSGPVYGDLTFVVEYLNEVSYTKFCLGTIGTVWHFLGFGILFFRVSLCCCFYAMRRNESEGRPSQVPHLIFVKKFPSSTSARQIWDICEQYGKVVDAFIPSRVSKEGKKFAFMCFIKLSNIDVLIGNLNTVWIGKFRLRFNFARFQRGSKQETVNDLGQKQHVRVSATVASSFYRSFTAGVSNKERSHSVEKNTKDKPVMVIDDDCLIEKNFKITLVAKVKGALHNLLKRILKPISDSGDEKNKESTPYTDICSGVQGKGGNESDINRDFENKTSDSIEEESNDPFAEGLWKPTGSNVLMIRVYARQKVSEKRILYNYLHGVLSRWHREVIMMGDFNEVCFPSERHGLNFNKQRATLFNSFIDTSSLIDVSLGGYSFTWAVRDATKMSKLDRFLFQMEKDLIQKAKMKWAIEGDENLKYFHGIINIKHLQMAIRRVLIDGEWVMDPPKALIEEEVSDVEIKRAV